MMAQVSEFLPFTRTLGWSFLLWPDPNLAGLGSEPTSRWKTCYSTF